MPKTSMVSRPLAATRSNRSKPADQIWEARSDWATLRMAVGSASHSSSKTAAASCSAVQPGGTLQLRCRMIGP